MLTDSAVESDGLDPYSILCRCQSCEPANGLIAGFAMLAAMLIGAALGLPIILSGVLAFGARRAKGVLAQWFWADTRQQLPGLSLALMALLLAMAANVGVSKSLRHIDA